MAKSDTSPAQVQKELKGIDYPASKQDLLDHVNKKEVRELLEQIPDKKYNSPVEVSKEVGKLE